MKELCDTGTTKFRKIAYPSIVLAFLLWFEYSFFEKLFVAGEFRPSLLFGPLILGGFIFWLWWQNEGQFADSVLDAGDRLVIKRWGITQTVELAGIEVGTDRIVYSAPGSGSAGLVVLGFPVANALGESITFFPESSAVAVKAQLETRAHGLRDEAGPVAKTPDADHAKGVEPGEWRLDIPSNDPPHGGE